MKITMYVKVILFLRNGTPVYLKKTVGKTVLKNSLEVDAAKKQNKKLMPAIDA